MEPMNIKTTNEKCNKIFEYLSSLLSSDSTNKSVRKNQSNISVKSQLDNKKSLTHPQNQIEFQNRLSSFEYGKYVNNKLSPLLCAKFGWILKESHVLQCSTCSAVISTSLPSINEYQAYETFLRILKNRLQNGHEDWCGWTYASCPDIFVHPPPVLSIKFLKTFSNKTLELTTLGMSLPYLNIKELLNLLNLEKSHLMILYSSKEELDIIKLIAALLTLFGWNFGENKTLKCSICLRTAGLWNYLPLNSQDEFESLKCEYEDEQNRRNLKLAKLERKRLRQEEKLEQQRLKEKEVRDKRIQEEEELNRRKDEAREEIRSMNFEEMIDQSTTDSDDGLTEEEESFLLEENESSNHSMNKIKGVHDKKVDTNHPSDSNQGSDSTDAGNKRDQDSEKDNESNEEKIPMEVTCEADEDCNNSSNSDNEVANHEKTVTDVNKKDQDQELRNISSSDNSRSADNENSQDDLWLEAVGCEKRKQSSSESSSHSSTDSLYSEENSSEKRKRKRSGDSDDETNDKEQNRNKRVATDDQKGLSPPQELATLVVATNMTADQENESDCSESSCSSVDSENEEDSSYLEMKKRVFNPLEEHRSWCGWVSKCVDSSGRNGLDWSDTLGYLLIPPQLKNFKAPEQGNYLDNDKFKSIVEGLRAVRETLSEWELPRN